jgi:cell division protein FtsA
VEKKNYVAAIDLGSKSVVVAVGSQSPEGKIIIEDINIKDKEPQSEGFVRGEVENAAHAAQLIRSAMDEIRERTGFTISEACIGISGSHIRCAKHPYHIYIEDKNGGEITAEHVQLLNDSMRKIPAPDGYTLLHVSPQRYTVDNGKEVPDPVGHFSKMLGSNFNLIIGEDKQLLKLEKVLDRAGVKQSKLIINALATAEAVAYPEEKEVGVAVVDIGAELTNVCIFLDGIMRYVGVIPMGADSINKDILSLGIAKRYVERLKVEFGCAMPSLVTETRPVQISGPTPHSVNTISLQDIARIIEARMMDIIGYVLEEIKVAGYDEKLGAGLILTGGGAKLNGVAELFAARTGMETRIGIPDIYVSEESKERINDPRCSAAVGILHQAMKQGVTAAISKSAPEPETDEQTDDDDVFEDEPRKGKGGKAPKEPKVRKEKSSGKLFKTFTDMFKKGNEEDIL